MFRSTPKFNQDISNWNVSNVINMHLMIYNTTDFNQDISSWDVDQVTGCDDFGSGMWSWGTEKRPNFTSCSL